jgi:nitroreductase/predicted amino acid-binding ACT domain protein
LGDLFEAVFSRRTIRRFQERPVEDAVLAKALEAARWAPSWANCQPWTFVVVRDAALRERLARADRSRRKPLAAAPVIVAVLGERGRSGYIRGELVTEKEDWWYLFDLGLAVENFSLAAHDLGLGSVIVGWFSAREMESILEVPAGREVAVLLGVGYPAEEPTPPRRRTLDELVSLDRPGQPWPAAAQAAAGERAIVTVLGPDRVGIIAAVAGLLSDSGANILDISETIVDRYLTMTMVVDLAACRLEFAALQARLAEGGREVGVQVIMQREDVFRYMHRI